MMKRTSKPGLDRRLCRRCSCCFFRSAAMAQQEPAVYRAFSISRQHIGQSAGRGGDDRAGLMKAEVPHSDPHGPIVPEPGSRPLRDSAAATHPRWEMAPARTKPLRRSWRWPPKIRRRTAALIATIAAYMSAARTPTARGTTSTGLPAIPRSRSTPCWASGKPRTSVSTFRRRSGTAPASWYMSVQSSAGSWNYHRDEASQPETCAMTAAGIGSLLICQRQLERYRSTRPRNQLALDAAGHRPAARRFQAVDLRRPDRAAVNRGIAWLSANFARVTRLLAGQTPYYMLYGVERIGALAEKANARTGRLVREGARLHPLDPAVRRLVA